MFEEVFDNWNRYDLTRPVNRTQAMLLKERMQLTSQNPDEVKAEYLRSIRYDHVLLKSNPIETQYVVDYMGSKEVRKALHIPDYIQAFDICNDPILRDYRSQMQASAWIYTKLKVRYNIMHYSGTTDAAIPTHGTKMWIKNANYEVTAPQREWKTNGNFSGHLTEYGKFKFVTVHGTGHMAPQWKRQEVTELISHFIHNEPIP